MKLKTLKGQVEWVLRENNDARNSDITLTIALWKRFYPQRIRTSAATGQEGIWLKDLFDLPREDNIKRVRAMFQNKLHMYLPTEQKIAEARGINIREWRQALGYPVPLLVHKD